MTNKIKLVFIIIIGGLLFSGYLSGVKLFTDTCAFNESCPYFLGYPACWYGFAMYLTMFIVTSLYFLRKISFASTIKTNLAISSLGILFVGNFVIQEILQSKITGTLGLSTCAYGLIFYILIFILSLRILHSLYSQK